MLENSFLEITEGEILKSSKNKASRYSYLRHVRQFESPSHRGEIAGIPHAGILPKTCQLDKENDNKTSSAVDILRYQLSDRVTQRTHLDSVRRSLEKRLQTAKARGDCHLIGLLEDEFKQLEMS